MTTMSRRIPLFLLIMATTTTSIIFSLTLVVDNVMAFAPVKGSYKGRSNVVSRRPWEVQDNCIDASSGRTSISKNSRFCVGTSLLMTTSDDDDVQPKKKQSKTSKAKKSSTGKKNKKKQKQKGSESTAKAEEQRKQEEKAKKREILMKQLKAKLDEKRKAEKGSGDDADGDSDNNNQGLLDKLNPFQAGQNLRKTIGRLTTLAGSGSGLSTQTKQKYYLDDRFLESTGGVLSERNPNAERLEADDYVPEVLVVGATGEVGRLVVRRLLLEGRFRVRVLVRDLYSQTLNLLGTGVTYCQGELSNIESLEYALTDVDKIIYCASAPRPDETDFKEKFEEFMKENRVTGISDGKNEDGDGDAVTSSSSTSSSSSSVPSTLSDAEWEQLSSILDVRARLAEQVDLKGMQNIVNAYQNVRFADYGTSQAAKRSLFKFSSRPEDFLLFAVDDGNTHEASSDDDDLDGDDDLDDDLEDDDDDLNEQGTFDSASFYDAEDDEDDEDYEDTYDDFDDEYYDIEARRDETVRAQVRWIRNENRHGVFLGKVPKPTSLGVGGEAAIVSSRLRSRDDPNSGVDLSSGFAGFIVRLCGDGSNFEAFIRTGSYEEKGIEYVCEFSTFTKPRLRGNKSKNKFISARLPFDKFRPVRKRDEYADDDAADADDAYIPQFKGKDVRFLGFRYRSSSNAERAKFVKGDNLQFYAAFSYVKVYRSQPEPEFVYVSDARIPPIIRNGMVRHDRRMLLLPSRNKNNNNFGNENSNGNNIGNPLEDTDDEIVPILDEKKLQEVASMDRSPEETYYKFRGEEVLKNSGLR